MRETAQSPLYCVNLNSEMGLTKLAMCTLSIQNTSVSMHSKKALQQSRVHVKKAPVTLGSKITDVYVLSFFHEKKVGCGHQF